MAPPIESIREMANVEHHVVLAFPLGTTTSEDFRALIQRFSKALPDHRVFDNGGDNINRSITILAVVPRETIVRNASIIRSAVGAYISSCRTMMADYKAGRVSRNWVSQEHGGHVRFSNRKSGQVIEAPLEDDASVESVDPFFFAEFVKSTLGHEVTAGLIKNNYHDAARMLEVMSELRGS